MTVCLKSIKERAKSFAPFYHEGKQNICLGPIIVRHLSSGRNRISTVSTSPKQVTFAFPFIQQGILILLSMSCKGDTPTAYGSSSIPIMQRCTRLPTYRPFFRNSGINMDMRRWHHNGPHWQIKNSTTMCKSTVIFTHTPTIWQGKEVKSISNSRSLYIY